MKRIALISDNHGYIGPDILELLEGQDEIWHAGDMGDLKSIEPLVKNAKVFRGVYGNIDTADTRELYPLNLDFEVEGVKVLMTHIGGYPGRYKTRVKALIQKNKPDLYICGHSHILKVMRDHENDLIHMNPGAYGHHGFHKIRTILTFSIHQGKIIELKAVELGIRGRIKDK
ncbi:MAG: metallophosphoesterase family protein [Saprospiraceae bacterium]|nr:metallophosphoesterase family protein [Saprospiraceae bacterium]